VDGKGGGGGGEGVDGVVRHGQAGGRPEHDFAARRVKVEQRVVVRRERRALHPLRGIPRLENSPGMLS